MEHLMHSWGLTLLVFSVLWGCVLSKQCTNVFSQSHTFRYELQKLLHSNNETLKKEALSHYRAASTDDVAARFSQFSRKMLKEEDVHGDGHGHGRGHSHGHQHDWLTTYSKIKNQGVVNGVEGLLKEVPLEDVRLQPHTPHWQGQQTNLKYLLLLDVDNLLWSFRKTAGLPTPGKPYGGWEAPDCELRGHFVGHYLSATARMWASTYNEEIKEKMTQLVSGLYRCQRKLGNGYLSAFPSLEFDRFENLQPVWAPYYTIHKILQGLLDQYTFAGSQQAFEIMNWMVDYFYNRVQNVIQKYTIERHWASLNEETGGMNDVLYQLYAITGNNKHLMLAHLFDKPCFLGELALKADDISGFHANTHIPVVVGAQMRYELTGDPLYKEMSSYFMDIINSSHTYATGGTSINEHWTDPKRLGDALSPETEEGCTVFNMLKVARHLFTWTKDSSYAEYYERALTNGILPVQRGTEPGVMIYMLPLQRGSSKARTYRGWGTLYDSFWCDYGMGVESFAKLGDSIYFEENGNKPGLYIIQYISNSFKWKSAGIQLDLQVDPITSLNSRLKATVTISRLAAEATESTLNFRIPAWAYGRDARVTLNHQTYSQPQPGSFLAITQNWTSNEKISIDLPLNLRTEVIQDDRPQFQSLQAILYGPYVLAGLSTGDWDVALLPGSSLQDLVTPIPQEYNLDLKTFSQESADTSFVLAKTNGSSVSMEKFPGAGTDLAVGATFRLVSAEEEEVGRQKKKASSPARGKFMLEPYDLPGSVLMHQGKDAHLTVMDASEGGESSIFNIVSGLDGQEGTVSFESENQRGCYIYSSLGNKNNPDSRINLTCADSSSNAASFNQAVSFKMEEGISQYDPMNFVMRGKDRNFLLTPLISLRDESYTVYFNFVS